MGLTLSEDQLIIKETARSFLADRSPVSRMRELRDARDATGFSRDLWQEMAEMGWPGIVFPEEFGTFLLASPKVRGLFLELHGDLLDPAYWRQKQAKIRAGHFEDVFPYPESSRFRRGRPASLGRPTGAAPQALSASTASSRWG